MSNEIRVDKLFYETVKSFLSKMSLIDFLLENFILNELSLKSQVGYFGNISFSQTVSINEISQELTSVNSAKSSQHNHFFYYAQGSGSY